MFESNIFELSLKDNEVVEIDVKGSVAGKHGKKISDLVLLILPLYLLAKFAELSLLFYTEIALCIAGFLLLTLPALVSIFSSKPRERYSLEKIVLSTK
ncbi:MAG: hypothetical protein ACEPOV_14755 [Hyphomicrobiales bacterium]